MRIAACQLPEVRATPDEAIASIIRFADRASDEGVRLLCFPECFLQGYLCERAAAARHAISLKSAAFDRILADLADARPMLVFGLIEADGEMLYNTAVVVDAGRLVGTYRKANLLPGERSTFAPGAQPGIFEVDGLPFGVNICSDTQDAALALAVASAGAKLIVCPANNMMPRQKADYWKDRHNETRACRAREAGVWLMSSDVTGRHGDSVGLGPTCIMDPQGRVVAQVPPMKSGMVVAEIELSALVGGLNHPLHRPHPASRVLLD